MQLEILYEDNHLLAVNKPAGLPTMGTPEGEATLLTVAKAYIKHKYKKPGDVYLGVMSRLDAPVTGVVILARTSKSAARLTEQFREHTAEKTYWALVDGFLSPASAELVDWVAEDERHRCMHLVDPAAGGKEARLSYRTLDVSDGTTWLEVALGTGRKHQIRLQLSGKGHPIIGDRKYGSARSFPAGIALHARRLVIKHPIGGTSLELLAPLPRSWPEFVQRQVHGNRI
jgi:23S rRNA pseudouridine1911/1915/1917 synthase